VLSCTRGRLYRATERPAVRALGLIRRSAEGFLNLLRIMTTPRKPLEPSKAEAKQALLKERADDAARATTDYKAEQEAERAKTKRLRALRLAKEKAEGRRRSRSD
jgi:hypothetical protein